MLTRRWGHQQRETPSSLCNIELGASVSGSFIAWHVACVVFVLQRGHSSHSCLERTNRTPENGTRTAQQDNIPQACHKKKKQTLLLIYCNWHMDGRRAACRREKGEMHLNVMYFRYYGEKVPVASHISPHSCCSSCHNGTHTHTNM